MYLKITKDDLCATCKLCEYDPVRNSACLLDFEPAVIDADSKITECDRHLQIDTPGENTRTSGIDIQYGGKPRVWR